MCWVSFTRRETELEAKHRRLWKSSRKSSQSSFIRWATLCNVYMYMYTFMHKLSTVCIHVSMYYKYNPTCTCTYVHACTCTLYDLYIHTCTLYISMSLHVHCTYASWEYSVYVILYFSRYTLPGVQGCQAAVGGRERQSHQQWVTAQEQDQVQIQQLANLQEMLACGKDRRKE